MFTEMRRNDRKLSDVEAEQILQDGKYGILSMIGENGYPYGVPMTYVYENGKIYFHCAKDVGMKVENLRFTPKASFTVVGETEILPDKFATKYESVIAFGIAKLSGDKKSVLEKILQKYSPDYLESGKKYINAMIEKTSVYEIQIEQFTGKARKNG